MDHLEGGAAAVREDAVDLNPLDKHDDMGAEELAGAEAPRIRVRTAGNPLFEDGD